MEPQEIKALHCLPHSHSSLQNLLTLSPTNIPVCSSSFFNRSFPLHNILSTPNTASLSADSTLNETNENQQGISHERRLKRMISNRESARRSRMRKKKQIEELQCQVNHLQTMNHQLSDKVIHLLESNHQILQENSQLKERVSSLQIVLSDLLTPIRNAEDNVCDTNRLRGEISN